MHTIASDVSSCQSIENFCNFVRLLDTNGVSAGCLSHHSRTAGTKREKTKEHNETHTGMTGHHFIFCFDERRYVNKRALLFPAAAAAERRALAQGLE